ncbi:MAG: hypothetical protein IAE91_01470 [Ignavibacteriaceae bacterium]|nr:hypothetical protein [Ignavibacteriaceae bacterium]
MNESRALEVASALEDMSDVLSRFVALSKELLEQFSETGLLTMEIKKEFDNIVFESEGCIQKADALLDSEEKPM